ncbi:MULTISPECIES: mechanosensitive ion channel domain-containing protein [unclassified Rickettsia]|uniref:mechanosensitive ion channel domain-containing protein n=1 Tax=unclassified Rickettsia TaxID=114295 RepID=UPI0020A18483|nr:mechanosensitive ion channel domain-containing protein [Rickettsia endosymbiont of Ceutorhynchus assimilis]
MQYLIDLYNRLSAEIIMLIIMLLSLIPLVLFIQKLVFAPIKNYMAKHHYDDYEKILRKYSIFRYLLHSLLGIYFIFWGNIFKPSSFGSHVLINIKDTVVILYTSISLTMLLLSITDAAADLYQHKIKAVSKNAPLSLYFQILKIMVIAIAIIVTISYLLNISLRTFLTSLGAAAALLTFVFKDTVLGLLASLQLTSQGIIHIGDWIRVGDIEGTVEKITISVVSIRNFDQSISTIPTYNIVNTNVTNYRGISEAGARRVQRVLNINMTTINFCDATFLKELKKSLYLSKNVINNINFDNENKDLTNLKLFKLYIQEYLKNNPAVYQEGFTFLVRQLAPTINGLPIEIYIFVKEVGMVGYENIQGDIFEHLISILPEFKLTIFQNIGIVQNVI